MQNPKGWGLYVQQKCLFYNLSFADKLCEYYDYYTELKMILDDYEIKSNLQINEEILTQVKQMHRNRIDKTIHMIRRKLVTQVRHFVARKMAEKAHFREHRKGL